MANMGTVSVSTQQFPIKRKLQETKKPAHPSDKSPEWLALNSPFHFPLRRTSCVPTVWPQIMAEAFSMMGEAHERTIITRKRTVKNLHLASGFSAIRTRSEQRLKTINGELARAISKFNAHLLIFLCNNPRSVAISRSCSRTASESSLIFLGKHARIDTVFWGLKISTT